MINRLYCRAICLMAITWNLVMPTTEKDARVTCYHYYLQGAYHHAHGNLAASITAYRHALKHHASPYAHIGLLKVLHDSGQADQAAGLITQHVSEFSTIAKQSAHTALLCTNVLVQARHPQATTFQNLLWNYHRNDPQVPYALASSLATAGRTDQALDYLTQGISNKATAGHHFMYHFLASKILMEEGKYQQALNHIEKSLKIAPQHDRRMLLHGVLLQQQGRVHEAISCFQTFLQHVGDDSAVEQQLVSLLFAQNRFAEASPYLDRIAAQGPEQAIDAALVHLRAGNPTQAETMAITVLAKEPTNMRARLLHIDLLLASNRQEQALESLGAWVKACPNQTAPYQAYWLLHKSGAQTQVLINHLCQQAQQTPSVPLLATLGDLYAAANDLNNASKTYRKIFALKPKQTLRTHLTFQLASLCYRARRLDLVERILAPTIEKNNHAPSCNLLAYVYAQGKRDLDKALILVDKALAQQPHNPAFLDTKAVVLFAMGKKTEAMTTLQQALIHAPHDATIRQRLVSRHKGSTCD